MFKVLVVISYLAVLLVTRADETCWSQTMEVAEYLPCVITCKEFQDHKGYPKDISCPADPPKNVQQKCSCRNFGGRMYAKNSIGKCIPLGLCGKDES